MPIKTDLSEIIKSAMKSGDKSTLTFGRNLHAIIRKKEIDTRTDLQDADIHGLIATSLKQRQDAMEQFKAGGREDLVTKEQAEIDFLKKFLPEQLSETELRKIVADAVAEAQATTAKDMGKVMAVLMPKVKGKADGKLVNQLVKEKLAAS